MNIKTDKSTEYWYLKGIDDSFEIISEVIATNNPEARNQFLQTMETYKKLLLRNYRLIAEMEVIRNGKTKTVKKTDKTKKRRI